MSYDSTLGDPGAFFYHYTTREAAFTHILPERRLRLSPASRMRDPLESKPSPLPAAFYVQRDERAEREMESAAMEATTRLDQLRRCSKILSLTIDAPGYEGNAEIFGRGYARARMWEQYSEQHRGVCLMLRRDAFRTTAIAQLTSRSPDSWADAVSYTRMGIVDDAAATVMPSQGQSGEDVSLVHLRRHWAAIFFTKLLDWQSEHEYRFVESSTEGTCTFVDLGDTLEGVIVGHEFPAWQKPGLVALCDQVGAEPKQMSWDRGRPSARPITSQTRTDTFPGAVRREWIGLGPNSPGHAET